MKVNGEAVYGTQANPILNYNPYGFYTSKQHEDGTQTLYFHIRESSWPKDGRLYIDGINELPNEASFLGNNDPVKTELSRKGITLFLPESPITSPFTVVAMRYGSTIKQTEGISQDEDGNIELDAFHSQITGDLQKENNPVNIGYWTSEAGKIFWRINISKSGYFKIVGNMLPLGGDGSLHVKIGDDQLNGNYTFESWEYRDYTIGSIHLNKGIYNVEVARSGVSPLNFRGLRLIMQQPDDISKINNQQECQLINKEIFFLPANKSKRVTKCNSIFIGCFRESVRYCFSRKTNEQYGYPYHN